MTQPQIEIIPLFAAVRTDLPITQDVLIRITPPVPEVPLQRPALNLGLVLDRSGSMAAQNKIGFAREAAIYAVQLLADALTEATLCRLILKQLSRHVELQTTLRDLLS